MISTTESTLLSFSSVQKLLQSFLETVVVLVESILKVCVERNQNLLHAFCFNMTIFLVIYFDI